MLCKRGFFKVLRQYLKQNSTKQYLLQRGHPSSFHNETRFIFCIVSLFGMLPVQNLYKKNICEIKTSMFSIIYVYSCLMFAGFTAITIHGIEHIVYQNTLQIDELKGATGPFIFYGTCAAASILFIDIAKKWPNIIKQWSNIEKEIYYIQSPTTSLHYATFIMALGLGEHLFHNWINTRDGPRMEENPVYNYVKTFCFNTHEFLVESIQYSHWKGFVILVFSFNGTILWNFIDVFIIIVTSGLRSQLRAWNQFANHQIQVSELCWETYRRDYMKIIDFVKLVDKNMNKIIGLSVINNFYFISAQLVEEVRMPSDKYQERLFFLCSFAFLILRAASSFLCAASVHDEWKMVSTPIHASRSQSLEVERILSEIHSDFVAMTAFNLVHMTRGLILAMFGVFLSYELLLVETHEAERLAALKNGTYNTTPI